MPAFSILIPTKDRPAMLVRAIHSALAQAWTDREIIVADDGTGIGIEAAAPFASSGVAAFSTGATGQVSARNQAVARAGGRWIAFLDDDDWWDDPDHLSSMAAALKAGAGLAYASGEVVPDQGVPMRFTAKCDAASIRRDNLLMVSGLAYARALHDEIGPFDETMPIYWDWDWYLRLAAAGVQFADTGHDGVRIALHEANVSLGNDARRQADLDRLCAKHGLTGIVLRNHESIARDQRGR